LLYADLHDPVGLLRGEQRQTELAKYWAYSARLDSAAACRRAAAADYTSLMSEFAAAGRGRDSGRLSAQQAPLPARCRRRRRQFLIEAAKRCEQAEADAVRSAAGGGARRAALRVAGSQGARAQAIGGDFLRPLPQGADVVSLVRVVHDHDDAGARPAARRRRALPPKGVLLLAEPMMGTPGAEPVGDAYFGFYLLAMGRGKPAHAAGSAADADHAAGFASTHWCAPGSPCRAGSSWRAARH
jgi:demethylspheroidene O-methyltransferase